VSEPSAAKPTWASPPRQGESAPAGAAEFVICDHTIEGAQAMLDMRSAYLNGAWDDFMRYRIAQATQRLYPYRALVEPRVALEELELPIAA